MQGWGWSAALKGFWINNDAELSVLEGSAGIYIKSCGGLSVLWVPSAATVTGVCHTGRIRMNDGLFHCCKSWAYKFWEENLWNGFFLQLALQSTHCMAEFPSQRNTRSCSATGTHRTLVSLLPESISLLPLLFLLPQKHTEMTELLNATFYLKFSSCSQNHWVWKRPPLNPTSSWIPTMSTKPHHKVPGQPGLLTLPRMVNSSLSLGSLFHCLVILSVENFFS